MSIDAFIDIAGIEGECVRKGVEKQIELQSWSWSGTAETNVHNSTGASTGKSDIGDLSITLNFDKSVPVLQKHLACGAHIDKATLTQRKAGDKKGDAPMDYIILKMSRVYVTSLEMSASSDGVPEVTVQLAFRKYMMEYQPQGKDGGKAGGVITSGYNMATSENIG